MRPVDYGRIAATYDALPIRSEVGPDPELAALTALAASGRAARVLDVGCGTGSYLVAQARAFGPALALTGLDPSEAMLARARTKLAGSGAELLVGRAEALPFADGSFDRVVSRFAFHHFADPSRALAELRRVLAPAGRLGLANLAPEHMPGFWMYAFFPEAHALDARFWSVARLVAAFAALGLEVSHRVAVTRDALPLREALLQAELRDQSHLAALEEADYARGLEALRHAVARDPEGAVASETAVLHLTGKSPG
ncbi:MAG: methyltransferase domain-containing protein [Myxococcales bacterium]|nr:methyltransferase domain-containing protein [Myxococcales bacterium]